MASKTDKKGDEKSVEIHVTEILGIPIARRYVIESSKFERLAESSTQNVQLVPRWLKTCIVLMMLLSVCASLRILYQPPRVLHELADSFLMGNTRRAEELQERVGKIELDKIIFKEGLDNCLNEKTVLIKSFNEAVEKCNQRAEEFKGSNENVYHQLKEDLNRKATETEHEFLRNQKEMKENLTSMKEQIDDLRRNEAELKETVDSVKKEKDEFLRNMTELKQMKEQKDDGEQKLNELETLKKDCEELLAEFREKDEKKANEEQQMANKKIECERAKHEVEEELRKKNESEKGLKSRIEDLQSNIIPELHRNISELEKDLSAEKESKASISKTLSEREATLRGCRDKNFKHRKTNAKLSTDINNLKGTVSSLEYNLADERKENKAVTEELEKSKLTLGKCKNKNFDHETGNAMLLDENASLKKQLEKC